MNLSYDRINGDELGILWEKLCGGKNKFFLAGRNNSDAILASVKIV